MYTESFKEVLPIASQIKVNNNEFESGAHRERIAEHGQITLARAHMQELASMRTYCEYAKPWQLTVIGSPGLRSNWKRQQMRHSKLNGYYWLFIFIMMAKQLDCKCVNRSGRCSGLACRANGGYWHTHTHRRAIAFEWFKRYFSIFGFFSFAPSLARSSWHWWLKTAQNMTWFGFGPKVPCMLDISAICTRPMDRYSVGITRLWHRVSSPLIGLFLFFVELLIWAVRIIMNGPYELACTSSVLPPTRDCVRIFVSIIVDMDMRPLNMN